jgi:Tol biopolymer transport system component
MSRKPGDSIGPYTLSAPLGRNGMGEVWQATDTKLQREVAIKALPPELANDEGRLARFRREAQVLASLNHSNVAAIYGIEEASGQPFLVLEHVPGEDLAERLKRGALSPEEAIEVARQVAEALEEAHEHGVVHRDLKPANVKVTPDGKVKVLDFGLAKAWAAETGSGSTPDLSQSPTLAHTGTAAGVILGTAAYMSPEQARGKPVDKRSDVWAFGALLHEMLTGRPLFAGETVSDVLAAVLTREPDWALLPSATPAAVRQLLRRCLERDPKRRLRDIGEARIALGSAAAHDVAAPDPAGAARAARPRWLVPALLVAAVAAFAAGWAAHRPALAVSPAIGIDTRVRQLTFEPGLEAEPSFSPDGNYVAYTSNDHGSLDVVVMPLAGGAARRLVATAADEAQPAWSPDGARIAFTSARGHGGRLSAVSGLSALSPFVQGQGGDILLVPAAGGPPVKLVERGSYPAWSPDGKSVVFQSDRSGHWDIWTVAANGGEPRPLTQDADADFQPSWSPDGRFVAYASLDAGLREGRLKLVASGGSATPRVLKLPAQSVASPAWSPDGAWIYFAAAPTITSSQTSLFRVSFDTAGDESPLVERLTLGATADLNPTLAAGGKRLAFAGVRYAPDLWALELASGTARQLTATSCLEDQPHLAPDGRTLVFFSVAYIGRDGSTLAIQPADGLLVRELVSVAPATVQAAEWSPDGGSLAYTMSDAAGRFSVRVVDLAGKDREVAAPGGVTLFADWSPDGRQLAFQREDNGPRQIWVVPAAGGEPRLLSKGNTRELSHPQWSRRDTDTILLVVEHENLATLSVATGALTMLTRYDDSTFYVDYPSWSPDEKAVYFSATRKVGDLFLLEQP